MVVSRFARDPQYGAGAGDPSGRPTPAPRPPARHRGALTPPRGCCCRKGGEAAGLNPSPERIAVRPPGDFVSVYGEVSCPPSGSSQCPLTVGPQSACTASSGRGGPARRSCCDQSTDRHPSPHRRHPRCHRRVTELDGARTVTCLSPSYSAAVSAAVGHLHRHNRVRVFGIGDVLPMGGVRRRRHWPGGVPHRQICRRGPRRRPRRCPGAAVAAGALVRP